MKKATPKTLRLILGDQLNSQHSWFHRPDPSVEYVLMEVRQETDYVNHHIQKVCAFFAAMREFANWLSSKGHRVRYLRLNHQENRQDLTENISGLIRKHGFTRFEYLLPDEYRLDLQLRNFSKKLKGDWAHFDTEHFLTTRSEVADLFKDRKQWRMESFYHYMRRQSGILMENGHPVGGQWNYDIENRLKYTGQVPLLEPRAFRNDVSDIVELLEKTGVKTFGEIQPSRLIWPITRRQALSLLQFFAKHLLPHFGSYQDAMTTRSWALFHSRLSFALNVKMLHPIEVIQRALAAWQERPKQISLPQIEGFVRQILGWREYMRGVYWKNMPDFAQMNYFNHRAKLPHYYWDGQTRMNCMAQSIGQSLEHAYAHHIQRLMITGNFALLAAVDPDQLDAWYLGVYIDAIQWVELPNTRGMSQFADGGITASKPYVSTANYIHSLSDYCEGCHYDRRKRHGEGACPFNSLHWDFYERHRTRLQNNPRVATMYRNWDRMSSDERRRTLRQAQLYKKDIENL
jgi:deoxyribodipyrimidine photolyase-related protein